MLTREFLRRYAYVYMMVVAFFLILASVCRVAVETVDARQELTAHPVFIIDAGHGGMDGGTTSCSGALERDINLEIAQRLEKLLALIGYDTVMTRTNSDSIATEGDTIRQQKQSDLRNRAAIVNSNANGVLVSIHQNHFPDSRYSGPQVFHAETGGSRELAQSMQNALNTTLGTTREYKAADGIYLMQNIQNTGILVECGFLSNPAEDAALQTKAYQSRLCCVIAVCLANYAEGSVSYTSS